MIFSHTHGLLVSGVKSMTRRVDNGKFSLLDFYDKVVADKVLGFQMVHKSSGRLFRCVSGLYAAQPRYGARAVGKVEVVMMWREPLQSMTEEDARREGFANLEEYKVVWDQVNKRRAHRWAANPHVFVYVVRYHKPEEE